MTATSSANLTGKRVLITGATRGIGAQLADAFAAAGTRHGVEVDQVAADLSEPDAPEQPAEAAWSTFSGLDVLISNAGLSHPETVTELSAAALDSTIAVNLRAPALLAARIGTAMADAGGGSIITLASTAGIRPLDEHFSYCLAKAGLVMATQVLAMIPSAGLSSRTRSPRPPSGSPPPPPPWSTASPSPSTAACCSADRTPAFRGGSAKHLKVHRRELGQLQASPRSRDHALPLQRSAVRQ